MEKGKTIVGSCVSRRLNFLIIDDLRGTKSSISFYRTNELAAGSKSEDREKASRDSAIRSGKGAEKLSDAVEQEIPTEEVMKNE